MEKDKEEKVLAINEKMVELREKMDSNLDDVTLNQALQEYTLLQIEKDDIINGTDNLKIKKKELEIDELERIKEKSGPIKKIKYIQRIHKEKNELYQLKSSSNVR